MHKAALDQIQNRWNAASDTWNIKALAQIYTHDALFFGLLPKLFRCTISRILFKKTLAMTDSPYLIICLCQT